MNPKEDKVLSSLQAQCARREYCTSDITAKALKALDGDSEAAERVVGKLRADRFFDDLRYASAFARDKSCLDGWGPVKIRHQLRGKGIDGAVIEAALAGIDEEKADSRLLSLVQAKARSLSGDPEIRLKLIQFALRRGYEYTPVDKAVKSVLNNK